VPTYAFDMVTLIARLDVDRCTGWALARRADWNDARGDVRISDPAAWC